MRTSEIKISVIVPTYKPQDYLWECLDSLVKQTFPKKYFEIIIVLNGCTEPWKRQIEEFICQKMLEMNVHFIHTEKGGVSNARNIALDIAAGEYVTFIDDDDFVSQRYLEILYANATSDTISLCYPYAFNDGDVQHQLEYSITSQYDKISALGKQSFTRARKYFSGPCMKLIPMSFIQDRRYDIRFKNGEDSLFMFLISDRFKYVDFTDHSATYYRRYRLNSAITYNRNKHYVVVNSIKIILTYFKYYFKHPLRYNMLFFATRILATIKSVFKTA